MLRICSSFNSLTTFASVPLLSPQQQPTNMSTTQNVNAPLFASANNKSSGASPGDPPAWLMEGSDPLDVDLLAEYLLDDAKPAPNGMTFDFR